MTPEEGATDRDYSLVPPVTPAEEAIMRRAFKDCDVGMDGSNCDEGAILAMRRALAEEREACAKEVGMRHVTNSAIQCMTNACQCEQIAAAIRGRAR